MSASFRPGNNLPASPWEFDFRLIDIYVPLPDSGTVKGVAAPSRTVSTPERAPVAVGVKVTLMPQLAWG